MSFRYAWAIWSSAFLLAWLGLLLLAPISRSVMWRVSLATMPFGLSEPLFVPAYWNPPNLFDLAQKTGFDLESLVFCFAIGGVGSVLYNVLTRQQPGDMPLPERELRRRCWHRAALFVPIVTFTGLYWLPWNPIYPAIVAVATGGVATALCRPDLARKALVGGAIFLGFYAMFMATLLIFAPGYIEHVWNLPQLTGIGVLGIPLEELLFGFTFGVYWTSVYEHLTWRSRQGEHVHRRWLSTEVHQDVMSTLIRGLWRTASAVLLLAFITPSAAAVTDFEKHADGLAIYMGVVPAQLLRGNTDASHLATMHGGLPSGSGSHHLVIAIYDEHTQRQVEGAEVAASVTPLGLGPTRRKLEPMQIGTSATYGNFFPMSGSGPYTVQVTIHVPGQTRTTDVQFMYSHPR